MTHSNQIRTRLLLSAGAAALAVGSAPVHAETVVVTDTGYAIAQNQSVVGGTTGVDATITSGASTITSGTVTDSSADVSEETYSTSVTGNTASSTLNSTTNNDTIGVALADLDASRNVLDFSTVSADDASLAVTTTQDVDSLDADSTQSSALGVTATNALRSTLTTVDNLQESRGVLNVQDSTVNLSANSTDASVGIASSQATFSSSVTSAVNGTTAIAVSAVSAGDVDQSTVSLTGNSQVGVAVANSGSNTIDATVNSATFSQTVPAASTTASASGGASSEAGFAVSSNQAVDDLTDVSATIGSQAGNGFLATVSDDVLSSEVANDSNSAIASARGNENTNTLSVTGNSLVSLGDDEGPVPSTLAAIANNQEMNGSVSAVSMAGADFAVRTDVDDSVENSTITTSSNLIDASATGNRGSNSVSLEANTIDTGAGDGSASTRVASTADAAGGATLASTQTMGGSVLAALSAIGGEGEPVSGAGVSIAVGDDIDYSSVQANANRLQASAIGNQITSSTNSISVSGNTVDTSTALANLQNLDGSVTALIGAPGTPAVIGTPDQDFTVAGVVTDSIWEGNILALSPEQKSAFIATYSSQPGWAYNVGTGAVSFTSAGVGNLTLPYTVAGTPDTPAIPASGGVTIAVADRILESTVTVDGNSTTGSVTGNTASNAISVSATNLNVVGALESSSDAVFTPTPTGDESAGAAVSANALANEQNIADTSTLDTTVSSEFSISSTMASYQTTDSSLSVSDNTQSATTRGNVVSNAIDLSAANMETEAAISSLQTAGAATVSSSSTMNVSAPGGMDGSRLALDSNSNTADATINSATNRISVLEGNVASLSSGANGTLLADDNGGTFSAEAEADFVMFNQQAAAGTADATATTRIANQESVLVADSDLADPVVDSSATADNNDTLVRAIANTSTNTVNLSGNSSFAATGGVLNRQDSTADVTATSNASVLLAFDNTGIVSPTEPVVTTSSLSVSGNTTQTAARGNVATNSMNVDALSLDANAPVPVTAGITLNSGLADAAASASYSVLNSQANNGDVSGLSTVSYAVALNGEGPMPAPAITDASLFASMVDVRGNLAQVTAAGNVSANSLTLTALNHGSSTGLVGNEQYNAGDITATLTYGAGFGATGAGAVQSSSVSVSGNSASATAVGNSATSVLTRQ